MAASFSSMTSFNRPANADVRAPNTGDQADQGVKIRVDRLTRRTSSGASILDGVSLQVMAGEIHGLIGPSGSGKTTVLRAMNRLWEPPAETVFFEGVDITKLDVVRLRRRVGMLFQSACLFDGAPTSLASELQRFIAGMLVGVRQSRGPPVVPCLNAGKCTGTVRDNVRYGPALEGLKLRDEEVEELLLQAGILDPASSFMEKNSSELSGGEAQRVALARTLANKPDVLLLDEPTSSLDQASTKLVENTILQLQRDMGLTVVLVSHSMEQVTRLVQRASLLNKGISVASGTLPELQADQNTPLEHFLAGQRLAN